MRSFVLTILGALALASTAQAEILSYQCQMRGADTRTWIQPVIFIAHNTETDQVVVSDPMILAVNDGQPLQAKLLVNNDKRITVRWRVQTFATGHKKVTMSYRATYIKGTGKVTVLAQPTGYSNSFNLGGTCAVKKLS